MITAKVAVDKATLNFDFLFSYIVPQNFINDLKIGSIVLVPFGKGDKLRIGIVLDIQNEENNEKKLKTIYDLKNQDISINENSLNLIKYLKDNVFCTWYEAVKAVLPYGALYKIQDKKLVPQLTKYKENIYYINEKADINLIKTQKQKDLYNVILEAEKSLNEIKEKGFTKQVLDNLVKNKLVLVKQEDKQDDIYFDKVEKTKAQMQLTKEQNEVFLKIMQNENKKPSLIYGVTSSGKTMIYINLISEMLKQGKGAMLLVPEISLTAQMINLLKSYFGDVVSVIHSKLTNTQRILQYNRLLSKKARVVIGTRSAVFAPVDNLGVIIIDEEHEKTFKSENSPRYSAIKVASFLAKNQGAKLVLASATPSIESYYLAKSGYYNLYTLKNRYNNMPLPEVEIIDTHQQALTGDRNVVSNVIIKYLAQNIIDNKQSIILINRRGYQTLGVCSDCKEALKCTDCSVNLVYHKAKDKLVCHYCSKTYDLIHTCPKCKGEIKYRGYGTQHIEEYIQNSIPTAKILRMDADTTTQNSSHQKMLKAFSEKEYDILIGTQMVAKGLDFKDVNLVCVLGVDASLNQISYNANETAFSLITQVIGRAGRQSKGAKAVIQTQDSQNPIINLAKNSDYDSFYNREIAYRKLNTYPPFCSLATVGFSHTNEVQCIKDAKKFLDILKENVKFLEGEPIMVLGPAPFDVEMVNKTYRYKLTLKCINNKLFRSYLTKAIDIYLKNKDNKANIHINLNPLQE